ncbi:hypothetical protein J4N45_10705 [Vibrio sp. SCSIO 43140]|jgi:cytochrome c553|uniref:hypothetical protein n=1 Tax=Vibrio sp. SCSIO 43140 TaxID=2819100 RepID=UPI0020759E44|nr:hypothetical protein [Vibrio sp. SCSIO 43140]USD59000.1 hypothetical protein J4N45_10705 [Vibrio sp. SCSIO 43140]
MLKRSFMLVAGMFSLSLYTYASEYTISAGESTFRTIGGYGCIACHGLYGQGGGNVGGNIRGSSLSELKYSLEHEQTMKLLGNALSEQDKINLADYMEYLGTFQLVDWMYEGTKGALLSVSIDSGKKSQLVVLNKTFEAMSIDLSPLAGKHLTLRVEPYETQHFEWLPEKGVYELSYGDEAISINVK